MDPLKELAKNGLYSPEQEHDACGVGVVANIKGQKTNQIIEKLNSYAQQNISEELLTTVLKTQSLVKEL